MIQKWWGNYDVRNYVCMCEMEFFKKLLLTFGSIILWHVLENYGDGIYYWMADGIAMICFSLEIDGNHSVKFEDFFRTRIVKDFFSLRPGLFVQLIHISGTKHTTIKSKFHPKISPSRSIYSQKFIAFHESIFNLTLIYPNKKHSFS